MNRKNRWKGKMDKLDRHKEKNRNEDEKIVIRAALAQHEPAEERGPSLACTYAA